MLAPVATALGKRLQQFGTLGDSGGWHHVGSFMWGAREKVAMVWRRGVIELERVEKGGGCGDVDVELLLIWCWLCVGGWFGSTEVVEVVGTSEAPVGRCHVGGIMWVALEVGTNWAASDERVTVGWRQWGSLIGCRHEGFTWTMRWATPEARHWQRCTHRQ